jgi:hypothetical protein
LQGLGEVAEKMKAISDLQCVRRTFSRTLGVGASAITADDFDSGVRLEPPLQTRRFSIRQKIDRPVSIQVDQDCSIALTLFPSPVIHAKGFDLRADNR